MFWAVHWTTINQLIHDLIGRLIKKRAQFGPWNHMKLDKKCEASSRQRGTVLQQLINMVEGALWTWS